MWFTYYLNLTWDLQGHKNVLNQLAHAYRRQFGGLKYSEELPLRVFWDVTRDLPDSGESFLGETYKDRVPHFRVLNYFTPQVMCSYLPLRENGVPVKGITVYACGKGTNSVIVHTRSSDLGVSATGRRGTPTSFYFRDGEEIVTIGLAAVDEYMDQSGPYLIVRRYLSYIHVLDVLVVLTLERRTQVVANADAVAN